MTIAEMIKKTRVDNDLTQEEYANKFGVSRQTVSSWENEKSIPDLQLIITICNTYNLSLDSLLNADHNYVDKIDMTKKIVRISKKILLLICIIICSYVAFFGFWKIHATNKNESFTDSVSELGFTLNNGIYMKSDVNTVYELPNQKLPFMKFEFNVQQITAQYRNETISCNLILNYDNHKYFFNVDYGLDGTIEGWITENGKIKYNRPETNDHLTSSEHRSDIEDVLHTMVEYYNTAYSLELK